MSEFHEDTASGIHFNKNIPPFPIKCICCGQGIIKEHYDICDVCGWEDDPVQNNDPDFSGGANKASLNEYRKEFERKKENEKK